MNDRKKSDFNDEDIIDLDALENYNQLDIDPEIENTEDILANQYIIEEDVESENMIEIDENSKSSTSGKTRFLSYLFAACSICCIIIAGILVAKGQIDKVKLQEETKYLQDIKEEAVKEEEIAKVEDALSNTTQDTVVSEVTEDADINTNEAAAEVTSETVDAVDTLDTPIMSTDMSELYLQNDDIVGWIKVAGTKINYPVMQTMEDENFYLNLGFDKKENVNGSLIMDTDSNVSKPSTNLIIHGHNMKSGEMFGQLDEYVNQTYCKDHNIVEFTTLYETRKYQVIAVFKSQVYAKTDTVFKYYKFFEATTQAEFDEFYNGIKSLALYDTGVTAEFGDEFITLSTCAYHVDNGRLVVVAKRIE